MAGPRQGFGSAPGTEFSDRRKQQQEQLRRKSELVAARKARVTTGSEVVAVEKEDARDVNTWISALTKIPLKPIAANPVPLAGIYVKLIREALGAMNSGEAIVVMTWPARDVCLSAVASLLALADVAVAKPLSVTVGGTPQSSFERPNGFKALLYPYARTTHEAARDVQIDRGYLGRVHMAHFYRHAAGNDEASALKDYHHTLNRVRTLTGKAVDGRSYPEFEHPTLDEILPHGSCDGKAHASGTLLWRTSSKTDLKVHNTIKGQADDGARAAYFLYGLRKDDDPSVALRRIRDGLDLVIVDLTRTGRNRLGEDWTVVAAEAFKAMRKAHPTAGVLVVTEDPWTFDKARFEIFNENVTIRNRPRPPAKYKTITAMSSSLLGEEEQVTWSGCETVAIKGFNGPAAKVAEDLRALKHKAQRAHDNQGAAAVQDIIYKLRRNASLPGSLASLSNFVGSDQGQAAAADLMSSYRIASAVQHLGDPSVPTSQIGGSELVTLLREAEDIMARLTKSTPMSSLLEGIVRSILNLSSKAMLMFRTQPLAEFATADLCRRVPELRARIENGMIVFSGPGGLTEIAALPSADRNKFKKIYVVAPPRDGVLTFFARSWLPSQVFVLADGDTLQFSSRDALRLAGEIEEPEIASRLRKFATASADEVSSLGNYQLKITETPPLPAELQFPSETVIDLAGAAGRSDVELLELTMEGGQKIIARPGTGLVRLDRSQSLEAFKQVDARDVRQGDELCVISANFIDRARLLLSIVANATEAIREYHEDVVRRFNRLPGFNDADRMRTLIERIGDPDLDLQRVRYWVHVDKQLRAQLHEVVTQAPRDHAMFLKFTAALGIGESLANRFWQLGVKAQRNSRMRAGMAFHDAYRNILTDPHAAAAFADSAKRISEIKRLQRLAEEHVSPVRSIRRFKW
ncbi:hypothetical protein HFO49_30065 [Rhizobium leguminosarum]|uniref:hypothetical protein n=1 Tax=Rhizobium leguminosarum TaxID=384 RepID=UPI001C979CAE|nr:hypothetical protein [Rhizobium leguminosarum]MBY5591657.1 hypothetical protein [Rhizobium leguminosarum]